jgi:hypothetical protein
MSTLFSTHESSIGSQSHRDTGWSTRASEGGSRSGFTTTIALSGETSLGGPGLLRTTQGKSAGRTERGQPTLKVKRRLQAFFIQEEGQEARVAFVENGTLIHYYLPLSLLREGGVRAENQPFELDEVETKVNGVVLTGYQVRASAAAETSRMVPLPLDDERKRKLERILKRRSDAQG